MAKKAARKLRVKASDILEETAAADPLRVIALMLWKDRLRNPDMYVQLTEADIRGLDDCATFLKVEPVARIRRPQGLPAQPAIPATVRTLAVAARPATPAKPYVVVTLVDRKTGDVVRPVENNQDDYDRAQTASRYARARERAGFYSQRLIQMSKSGEYSTAEMDEAADALLTLAGGPV